MFSGSRRLRRPASVIEAVSARLAEEPNVRSVSPVAGDRWGLEVLKSDGTTQRCETDKLVPVVLDAKEEDQARLIDGFVIAATSGGPGRVTAKKLVPAIRPKAGVTPGTVTRPFAGDVAIVLMLDNETMLAPVASKHLEAAGIGEDEAWSAAGENLRPHIATGRAMDIDGCMSFETDTPWIGSSALVMPDLFHSFRRKMGANTLYLAAPRRDSVHFVNAEEPGALDAVQRVVIAEQSAGSPQSACVFRLGETDTLVQAAFSLEGEAFRPN